MCTVLVADFFKQTLHTFFLYASTVARGRVDRRINAGYGYWDVLVGVRGGELSLQEGLLNCLIKMQNTEALAKARTVR